MDVELVLVDFDDTIVETAPRFQRARQLLFQRLADVGFDLEQASRVHHEEIDPVMLQRHGLGPGRLVHSFPETYRRLCAMSGSEVDSALVGELVDLAGGVAGTPPPLPGALEALRRLGERHRTIVYTQSGEPEYQLRCVEEAGVFGVLGRDAVRVTDRKTPERMREALLAYGVATVASAWMIGNSIRADVNPALAIGARAIHVEIDDPWHHDEVEPLHRDFPSVRSLAEAAELLLAG